jgi:hypothetical protein
MGEVFAYNTLLRELEIMNKSDVVIWLQEENGKWQVLLDEIGAERMDEPGVMGDWSMKYLIAHLNDWNRQMVAQLQAAQRGEAEPPPPWGTNLQNDDQVNAWIYESNRGRSASEVLEDTRQVNQQILALTESLPADIRIEVVRTSPEREYYLVWLGDKRYQPGEFFDHFKDDHEADVRAWLARGGNK